MIYKGVRVRVVADLRRLTVFGVQFWAEIRVGDRNRWRIDEEGGVGSKLD